MFGVVGHLRQSANLEVWVLGWETHPEQPVLDEVRSGSTLNHERSKCRVYDLKPFIGEQSHSWIEQFSLTKEVGINDPKWVQGF